MWKHFLRQMNVMGPFCRWGKGDTGQWQDFLKVSMKTLLREVRFHSCWINTEHKVLKYLRIVLEKTHTKVRYYAYFIRQAVSAKARLQCESSLGRRSFLEKVTPARVVTFRNTGLTYANSLQFLTIGHELWRTGKCSVKSTISWICDTQNVLFWVGVLYFAVFL